MHQTGAKHSPCSDCMGQSNDVQLKLFLRQPDLTRFDTTRRRSLMRWLQLRFDFDSTAVRLLMQGH